MHHKPGEMTTPGRSKGDGTASPAVLALIIFKFSWSGRQPRCRSGTGESAKPLRVRASHSDTPRRAQCESRPSCPQLLAYARDAWFGGICARFVAKLNSSIAGFPGERLSVFSQTRSVVFWNTKETAAAVAAFIPEETTRCGGHRAMDVIAQSVHGDRSICIQNVEIIGISGLSTTSLSLHTNRPHIARLGGFARSDRLAATCVPSQYCPV
jgi:hypothetical protein